MTLPGATSANKHHPSGPVRVTVIVGTRPEAVKVAPVIARIRTTPGIDCTVVSTGQHRQMVEQILTVFGIRPDHDLQLGRRGQSVNDIAREVFTRLPPLLVACPTDVVLVQGDTTSAMAAAVVTFNQSIPVVHLEAGLRSASVIAPFPEEANRRLIAPIAHLHLAPTTTARRNLQAENVDAAAIVVTGNTVIDALDWAIAKTAAIPDDPLIVELDEVLASGRHVVVATVHRRESWGRPLEEIAGALRDLAAARPEIELVVALHPNPVARQPLERALSGSPNACLVDALDYVTFCRLLARASLVLTDSGGIQEEAPSLGIPVVVLRDVTERTEALGTTNVLAGTTRTAILATACALLDRASPVPPAGRAGTCPGPFGDGDSARRVVESLLWSFGGGARPADYVGMESS